MPAAVVNWNANVPGPGTDDVKSALLTPPLLLTRFVIVAPPTGALAKSMFASVHVVFFVVRTDTPDWALTMDVRPRTTDSI